MVADSYNGMLLLVSRVSRVRLCATPRAAARQASLTFTNSLSLLKLISMDGRVSRVAQMVKNLPAMPETRVRSLGGEDSLEKGMTAHFSLAW